MSTKLLVLAAALAAACGPSAPVARERPAAAPFVEVPIDTAHGLSGLAVDERDRLWTVAERAHRAYRISLDPRPLVEELRVDGVPPDTDLEGIAVLGGDRFALGTEGRIGGIATVLLAELRGRALVVTDMLNLPAEPIGISLAPNHGAEGVCGAGETLLVAIESAGETDGRRWAPIVRLEGGAIARTYRLWLTSSTGKISGLDCQLAPDGAIHAWAIERHFEVTRILSFTLPAGGADEVAPRAVLDLAPFLHGRLNLEGIARMSDGRLIAVVDNQWKTITGPSELLVLPPGALE